MFVPPTGKLAVNRSTTTGALIAKQTQSPAKITLRTLSEPQDKWNLILIMKQNLRAMGNMAEP